MVKRYRVRLAEEEQQGLKSLVPKGRVAAYRQTHARILLLCDENQVGGAMKDEEIARALKVGTATVERVRRRGVEEGLKAALGRRQQLNRRQRKLDGAGEAHLIALVVQQLWNDGMKRTHLDGEQLCPSVVGRSRQSPLLLISKISFY